MNGRLGVVLEPEVADLVEDHDVVAGVERSAVPSRDAPGRRPDPSAHPG